MLFTSSLQNFFKHSFCYTPIYCYIYLGIKCFKFENITLHLYNIFEKKVSPPIAFFYFLPVYFSIRKTEKLNHSFLDKKRVRFVKNKLHEFGKESLFYFCFAMLNVKHQSFFP